MKGLKPGDRIVILINHHALAVQASAIPVDSLECNLSGEPENFITPFRKKLNGSIGFLRGSDGRQFKRIYNMYGLFIIKIRREIFHPACISAENIVPGNQRAGKDGRSASTSVQHIHFTL